MALLIHRDTPHVLDLLYAVDRVPWLHVQSDRLASKGFGEIVQAAMKMEYQVDGRFLPVSYY